MFTVFVQPVSGCVDLWTPSTFVFGVGSGGGCYEWYTAHIEWDVCAGHTVTGYYTVALDLDHNGSFETVDVAHSATFSFTATAGVGSWDASGSEVGVTNINSVSAVYRATFYLYLDGSPTPLVLTWDDFISNCG